MFLSKRTLNICNKLACNFQFPRVPSIFEVFYQDPQYWICLTKLTLNIGCVRQSVPSVINELDRQKLMVCMLSQTVQTIQKNQNPLTPIYMGPTHKTGFHQETNRPTHRKMFADNTTKVGTNLNFFLKSQHGEALIKQ
jgi:hypothetical protein